MKICEIKEVLDADVLAGVENLNNEVSAAFSSDLMSDVMAFVETEKEVVLLTGLINPQVIRTAEMMDIKAIVFVRGKVPNEAMLQIAKDNSIVILSTEHSLYIASGLLYNAGLVGKGMREKNER